MTQDSIGARISTLRTRSGLSREDLAELSGLSLSGIGLIETEKRTDLVVSTLKALSSVFGTDVGYLATGNGAAPDDHALLKAVSEARSRRSQNTGAA